MPSLPPRSCPASTPSPCRIPARRGARRRGAGRCVRRPGRSGWPGGTKAGPRGRMRREEGAGSPLSTGPWPSPEIFCAAPFLQDAWLALTRPCAYLPGLRAPGFWGRRQRDHRRASPLLLVRSTFLGSPSPPAGGGADVWWPARPWWWAGSSGSPLDPPGRSRRVFQLGHGWPLPGPGPSSPPPPSTAVTPRASPGTGCSGTPGATRWSPATSATAVACPSAWSPGPRQRAPPSPPGPTTARAPSTTCAAPTAAPTGSPP